MRLELSLGLQLQVQLELLSGLHQEPHWEWEFLLRLEGSAIGSAATSTAVG